MTSPAEELQLQRFQTLAFIEVRYTIVTLIPRVSQKSGTGTLWVDQPARDPQTVRLIDQTRAQLGPVPGTVRGADGRQRRVEYQLLAAWDAEVGMYDWWTDDAGIRWEIADLIPDNGYERRAQVVRYGES